MPKLICRLSLAGGFHFFKIHNNNEKTNLYAYYGRILAFMRHNICTSANTSFGEA